MANYWATHDREVTLITLSAQTDDWYVVHPNVRRIGLNALSVSHHIARALRNNIQIVRLLRHELQRAPSDAVISFGHATNIVTLMACWRLGMPVVVSERTDPREHPIGSIWTRLRSLIYRHADALVVQSLGVRDWARTLVDEDAIHVIPNPVSLIRNEFTRATSRQRENQTVIAMGRLSKEKGFDLLLRAFSQCAKEHSGWSLIIPGEGAERKALEMLIIELGIANRVSLPGRVKDPIRMLQSADLFVLPSRYEGFPNALLEAMACGLAVISTDCPSGPREIIRNGVDGLLIPPNDIDALAVSMDRLMANKVERQRLGARAVEVTERFGVEKVMSMWNDLLIKTCEG
jgi:glycosyltransferase involved in cell wall biosynthesis